MIKIPKETKLRPYLSNLTAKGYSSLFTGADGKLKLCYIDKEHIESVHHNGVVTLSHEPYKPIDFEEILKPIEGANVDLPLMQAIYSVLYQSIVDGKSYLDNNTLTIKKSDLASYMGTRADKSHITSFNDYLWKFNSVYGYYSNGTVKKFLTLTHYDKITDTFQFDVTLLRDIIDDVYRINLVSVKNKHKKEFVYELPNHSFLIHSNISRKNKNAYYLVTQIEVLLVQAGGNVKDPHIRFDTLIQRVPSLWTALESDKSRQYKNELLKRAFTKMYDLLKSNTDLYEYFIDLQIPEIIPTQSSIDEVLQIMHKGINKDYKPKK